MDRQRLRQRLRDRVKETERYRQTADGQRQKQPDTDRQNR